MPSPYAGETHDRLAKGDARKMEESRRSTMTALTEWEIF
jgi:hypothetical protein